MCYYLCLCPKYVCQRLCYVHCIIPKFQIFLLLKGTESSVQASDAGENVSAPSAEGNIYSVFGGEFVASKQGKPLERERWVSCCTLPVTSLCTHCKPLMCR